MCVTAFSPYTNCKHSCKPDPFITVPILPKKLISEWKPPRRQTIFKDFSVEISIAFNHNGWSKVMYGVPQLAFLDSLITNNNVDYTQLLSDGLRLVMGRRLTSDFPFLNVFSFPECLHKTGPTWASRSLKCKRHFPENNNIPI